MNMELTAVSYRSFIGSSGGGIGQVVHRSAVEQVVTLTAGVTVPHTVQCKHDL